MGSARIRLGDDKDMKKVSAALQNLIMEYMNGTRNTWYIAELYVFWLNSGQTLLYTGHDVNLTVGGNVYQSWPIDHGDIIEERGIKVSDTEVTVYFNPNDIITGLGVTWYKALQSGAFDNCTLSIDRLYSPIPWQYIMPPMSTDYVLKGRFLGRIDVDELHLTSCQITVKSAIELLNIQLPRNLIVPSCLNTLYDSMCTLKKENYVVNATAQVGSSKNSIVTGLTKSNGYFSQGMVLGVTGANTGVKRTIKTYAGGTANLFLPFLFAINPGDTFKFYPGCGKTIAACQAFNNLAHFRGMPFLPTPETML